MIEPGRDLDFAQEAGGADGPRDLGTQHLDGDGPVVLFVFGPVHDGHAAPAQLPLYAVPPGEAPPESFGDAGELGHGVQGTAK